MAAIRQNFPVVSIIIPAYNAARYLAETVESIQNQTYTHFECFIINDHSTDNTEAIAVTVAKTDQRFKLVNNENSRPQGVSSSRNIGLGQCVGKYVQFLDADDLALPAMLDEKVKLLEETGCDAAICGHREFEQADTGVKIYGKLHPVTSTIPLSEQLSGRLAYFVSGPMWRKDHLDKNRLLFDVGVGNMEDLDFNIRAIHLCHASIRLIPDAMVLYRRHSRSLSSRQAAYCRRTVRGAFIVRQKLLRILPEIAGTEFNQARLALCVGFCHGVMMASGARSPYYMVANLRAFARTADNSFWKTLELASAALLFAIFKKGTRLFAHIAPANNGYFSPDSA